MKELVDRGYLDAERKYFRSGDYEYQELVETFADKILIWQEEKDYSGSTWALLKRGDQYGYIPISWGSCSGCDALRGCNSYQEIVDLRDQLQNETSWGTLQEVKEHVERRDAANSHYHQNKEFISFLEKLRGFDVGNV